MNKVVDKIWRKNCYFTIATAKDTPMTQNVSSFFLSFANEWLPCDKRTPCFLMGLYSPWLKWWLSTSTRTAHNGHLSHVVCSLYWRLLWLALRYDDFRHCDPGFLPKKKRKKKWKYAFGNTNKKKRCTKLQYRIFSSSKPVNKELVLLLCYNSPESFCIFQRLGKLLVMSFR
jgi:hypothetical protein